MVENEPLVEVVDQHGTPGTLPQSQVQDAVFRDKLFKLAPVSPIKPQDIAEDGTVNVVNPDGISGTLPIDELTNATQPKSIGGGGYLLQSQHDIYQDPEVQHNVDLIKKAQVNGQEWKNTFRTLITGDFKAGLHENEGNDETRELTHKMRSANVIDQQGNYRMTKDGHDVAVPRIQIDQARNAGYEFQDPNFQKLVNAYIFLDRDPNNKGSNSGRGLDFTQTVTQGAKNAFDSIPLVGTGIESLADVLDSSSDISNVSRASDVALTSSELHKGYQTVRDVGTGVGIAAQLLAPEGLLGEVALAGKAGKAIKAAKVLEESPVLASVLGHAAQGLVISTPQIADALIKNNPKLAAESLALGVLGGVVLGELPNALNAGSKKISQIAGEKLTGLADNALNSVGATSDVIKLESQAKQKIMDSLIEAGLKESATAEKTVKVLNEVSGGSQMSVLEKLEGSGEKILTAPLTAKINGLVRIEENGLKLSPELESAVSGLNQKIEKLFPEGEASLTKLQKLSSELTEGLGKIRSASEVNNFSIGARDLIMEELINAGDSAALKADARTAALWGEQKGIAQAATQMQVGFSDQIAAAEKLAGGELSKDLKDKLVEGGVKHLFHAVGAAAGHAILPHVGGWIGSKIGGEIGESLTPFLKNIIPDSPGKSWLLKNANNPDISSYLTMNAIHNTNLNISKIPEFVKNPVIKSVLFANHPEPIKDLLGSQANGLSKSQQFDRLSSKVALLAGNDQLRNQYLDSVANTMAKNHPELVSGLKAELQNRIMTTNTLLNSGNKEQPNAFQTAQKYTPSKDKMAEIESGLNAIRNPYSIMAGLKDGRVNAKQVELVKQTHPAIFQEIVNQINKEAYSGKTELNYQQRISASIITGQKLDPSLNITQPLQATYAQPTGGAASGGSSNNKGKKHGSGGIHADKVSSYTAAQRISK